MCVTLEVKLKNLAGVTVNQIQTEGGVAMTKLRFYDGNNYSVIGNLFVEGNNCTQPSRAESKMIHQETSNENDRVVVHDMASYNLFPLLIGRVSGLIHGQCNSIRSLLSFEELNFGNAAYR
jgi:hypothetical protein